MFGGSIVMHAHAKRRASRFASALIKRTVVLPEGPPPTVRDPMVLVRAALSVSDQNDDPTAPWQYLDLDPIVLADP